MSGGTNLAKDTVGFKLIAGVSDGCCFHEPIVVPIEISMSVLKHCKYHMVNAVLIRRGATMLFGWADIVDKNGNHWLASMEQVFKIMCRQVYYLTGKNKASWIAWQSQMLQTFKDYRDCQVEENMGNLAVTSIDTVRLKYKISEAGYARLNCQYGIVVDDRELKTFQSMYKNVAKETVHRITNPELLEDMVENTYVPSRVLGRFGQLVMGGTR